MKLETYTKWQCDRCDAEEAVDVDRVRPSSWATLYHTSPSVVNAKTTQDICGDCVRSLGRWWDRKPESVDTKPA